MTETTDADDREAAGTLRARARALARPRQQAEAVTVELVEFRLAHERYAFETACVHDVQPLRDLTPLPCTPAFLNGLVNVRGRVVAVVDLRSFFGLPCRGITDLHRIVLLRDQTTELGVLAESVEGITRVEAAAIEPSLATLTGIRERYLRGVTVDRLVVLDARAILSDERLVVDDDADLRPSL